MMEIEYIPKQLTLEKMKASRPKCMNDKHKPKCLNNNQENQNAITRNTFEG